MQHDLLIEILTEELPPKTLHAFAQRFFNEFTTRLDKMELSYAKAQFFATPRRLALWIKKLSAEQPDTMMERRGPAIEAAFKNGAPTPACIGFARSLGITPDQLITLKTDQGAWVGYQQKVRGQTVQAILPSLLQQTLTALPIAKPMRWGNGLVEFIRPVHSVILLYGDAVIDAEILGCRTGRMTRGHRFYHPDWVAIKSPAHYVNTLKRKHVIVDFDQRKELIRTEATRIASEQHRAHVVIDENLLEEVTGLVEWPVAIMGSFAQRFLSVPAEALIAAMQDHQRYFPIVNSENKLLAHFVAIANIESRDMPRLIAGNERVLSARLSDAAFFFAIDQKENLSTRVDQLKQIIFQAKLGTLFDKTKRIALLTVFMAEKIQLNIKQAERAALLAKTDLTTSMVGEFPELQGVMGYYYALHDGEDEAVARALQEQYLPRFSGDAIPATLLGCILAIADRMDTLVGIFGIQQAPTGDKDPFALRRAALGILRIIIEKKLDLDLRELIEFSVKTYAEKFTHQTVAADVFTFFLDRLKPWYQEQGILADVFASVSALKISKPYDMHLRIQAVQHFKKLPEAKSLSVANKRVSNILTKSDNMISAKKIDEKLFENDAERALVAKLAEKRHAVISYSERGNYTESLTQLASLREPVDNFFDQVMVMSDDKMLRENRLLMLKELRELFLHVADIALLQ